MEMKLSSRAFEAGGLIPSYYTCDAQNVSPPLSWSNVPEGTKSLVLICDDPDAPQGVFVHWVYYNIPPELTELPEDVLPIRYPSQGGEQGTNDFNRIGYGGPCPPSDTHRYVFKLYALDTELRMDSGARKEQIEKRMEGHILSKGQMIGMYEREEQRSAA